MFAAVANGSSKINLICVTQPPVSEPVNGALYLMLSSLAWIEPLVSGLLKLGHMGESNCADIAFEPRPDSAKRQIEQGYPIDHGLDLESNMAQY